jgi:hypothetical protein
MRLGGCEREVAPVRPDTRLVKYGSRFRATATSRVAWSPDVAEPLLDTVYHHVPDHLAVRRELTREIITPRAERAQAQAHGRSRSLKPPCAHGAHARVRVSAWFTERRRQVLKLDVHQRHLTCATKCIEQLHGGR